MKLETYFPIFEACRQVKQSICLEGLHGIGKSALPEAFALKMGYHFTHLFAGHQETSDLIGLLQSKIKMRNGKEVTVGCWDMPEWLDAMWEAYETTKKPCVFLFDEFNRAQEEVRQMGLGLFLNQMLHRHMLPPGTLLITAINPESSEDNELEKDYSYTVNFLDDATRSRFLLLHIHLLPEDWLEWAENQEVHPFVIQFLSKNPDYLHHKTARQSMNPDPRSWFMLSQILKNLEAQNDGKKIDSVTLDLITIGKLGNIVGTAFGQYYQSEKLYTLSHIETLLEPMIKVIPRDEKLDELEDATYGQEIIPADKLPEMYAYRKGIFDKYLDPLVKAIQKDFEKNEIQPTKMSSLFTDIIKKYGKRIKAEDHAQDFWLVIAFCYAIPLEIFGASCKTLALSDPFQLITLCNLDVDRFLIRSLDIDKINKSEKVA